MMRLQSPEPARPSRRSPRDSLPLFPPFAPEAETAGESYNAAQKFLCYSDSESWDEYRLFAGHHATAAGLGFRRPAGAGTSDPGGLRRTPANRALPYGGRAWRLHAADYRTGERGLSPVGRLGAGSL